MNIEFVEKKEEAKNDQPTKLEFEALQEQVRRLIIEKKTLTEQLNK